MTVGEFLEKIRCFQKDFLSQGSKALHIQRHKKMQRWCCSIWSEKHTSDQYHWGREWQKRARVCWVPAQLCARPVLASHQYHPTWGAQPNTAGPTVTSVSQRGTPGTRDARLHLCFPGAHLPPPCLLSPAAFRSMTALSFEQSKGSLPLSASPIQHGVGVGGLNTWLLTRMGWHPSVLTSKPGLCCAVLSRSVMSDSLRPQGL